MNTEVNDAAGPRSGMTADQSAVGKLTAAMASTTIIIDEEGVLASDMSRKTCLQL